jgi:murein DD-endopeptidase MepM/ murein hydrolase activator NlpD
LQLKFNLGNIGLIFVVLCKIKMIFLSKSFIRLFSFLALMLFFGCAQKPAKIVNRSKVFYSKNNQFNRDKYQDASKKITENNLNDSNDQKNKIVNKASAPTTLVDSAADNDNEKNDEKITENKNPKSQEKLSKNADSQLNIKDSKENNLKEIIINDNSETIYSLAKKYHISTSEIINNNKLEAPYKLHKGDRIFIPQAQFHMVKNGETLFSISRLYNMSIDEMISANNLTKPYNVKVGNKLQITNFVKDSSNKNNEIANKNINSQSPQMPNTKSSGDLSKNTNNQALNSADEKNNIAIAKNTTEASLQNESSKQDKSENMAISEKIDDKKNIFSWPVRGSVVSKFGPKKGGLYNDGINIKAKEGASVGSSEDGIVAYAGNELKGYGNLIIIKHAGGWITAYAHLKEFNVSRGEKILKAQKIGSVGNTGNVSFPQLYFGLRKGREAINPQNYLKSIN